jgi:hypothetical protein
LPCASSLWCSCVNVVKQIIAFTSFCSFTYPSINPSLNHTHSHVNEHFVSNLVAVFLSKYSLERFCMGQVFSASSHHCNRIYTCDSYHHRMPLCSINGWAQIIFWHNFRTWNMKYFIRFELNACQTMFKFQNYSMGLNVIVRTCSAESYKANDMLTLIFFIRYYLKYF